MERGIAEFGAGVILFRRTLCALLRSLCELCVKLRTVGLEASVWRYVHAEAAEDAEEECRFDNPTTTA